MKYIYKAILLFVVVAVSLTTHGQTAQYSKLWGKDGETWNHARLPDFTKAGYREGKAPIPSFPIKINLKKTGAKGDGLTDDTKFLRKAIAACPANATLFIPAGTYVLSDTLIIKKSGVCIRGAGTDKTVLVFKQGIEELYPDYGKHNQKQSTWSWSGGMLLFTGNIQDAGIENLSIRFPDSAYNGHDFHERGYNAIGFSNGANNCWVRDINVVGADINIWIEASAHHITATHWVASCGTVRAAQNISGHHALNIYGGYNLLESFEITSKYVHDLSVEGKQSIYNVFHSGKAKDLAIDHHNHEQSLNLFTDLDAGTGSRLYLSGGYETPRGICSNETFWNIRSQRKVKYCNQYDDATGYSKNNVCVGLNTDLPSIFGDVHDNWFEQISPVNLYPQNLYHAQIKRKI